MEQALAPGIPDIMTRFGENAMDVVLSSRPPTLNQILFNGARHIDSALLADFLKIFEDPAAYYARVQDEKKKEEQVWHRIEIIQRTEQIREKAIADAQKKSGEINLQRKQEREAHPHAELTKSTATPIKAAAHEEHRKTASTHFNQAAPGIADKVYDTGKHVFNQAAHAYHTAHHAVGDAIESVAGKEGRHIARATEKALTTGFNIVTNPIGASVAVASTVAPAVTKAASDSWNWTKNTVSSLIPGLH